MTITASNDTVTYKSPRGDIERPADLVVTVQSNGSGGFIDPALPSQVVGNVADGAADTGNAVKIGAIVAPATLPAIGGSNRISLYASTGGILWTGISGNLAAGSDGALNSGLIFPGANTGGGNIGATRTGLAVCSTLFNGTTWDRARGDVNGQWVTPPSNYETVAASQTAQALGATGATGDYIDKLIIIPATVAPGVVTLLDNATSIPIWVGGTVGADLKPFVIDLGMKSVSGAWKVTTGVNVSVIGVGRFT